MERCVIVSIMGTRVGQGAHDEVKYLALRTRSEEPGQDQGRNANATAHTVWGDGFGLATELGQQGRRVALGARSVLAQLASSCTATYEAHSVNGST